MCVFTAYLFEVESIAFVCMYIKIYISLSPSPPFATSIYVHCTVCLFWRDAAAHMAMRKKLMKWKQSAHLECEVNVTKAFYSFKMRQHTEEKVTHAMKIPSYWRYVRIRSHVSVPSAFIIVCSGKRWFKIKLNPLSEIGSFYFQFVMIWFYLCACPEIITLSVCGWVSAILHCSANEHRNIQTCSCCATAGLG